MKKQLLSILGALTIGTVVAQIPSPSWTIAQNPNFTTNIVPIAGTRFMDAVDANVVWLSGYDGSLGLNVNYNWYSRTINGGASFNSGSIFADTNTYRLSNMEGVDANTAWVCSYLKATQGDGAIHRTTNGGATWQLMTAPGMFTNTAQSFGNFITFLTPQNGIVNGDPIGPGNGEFEIWTTSNGGTSWSLVPVANIPNPLAGEFAITNLYCKDGTTNVWFGTNKGRIYRTTDAGTTWNVSSVSGVATTTVVEVAFSGPNNGLVLLSNGTALSLYNSTDGGVTWNLINGGNLPTNYGTLEMSGIPGTTFFASVDAQTGFLSYSLNNGVTWIDWGSVGIPYLTIDFVNAYTAWVGGFEGAFAGIPGIYKYNGVTFNALFNTPTYVCKPNSGNVTVTPVNNSTGAAPLTFSWSSQPGATFSSNTASVPVITFSATGVYTITLMVTNGFGQSSTSTQVINVVTCVAPAATFNLPSTACNNAVFTVTNTATGVPLPTYTITTSAASGVTMAPGANGNQVTIKFASPGVYSITSLASSISGTNAVTQTINILDCSPNTGFTLSPMLGCVDVGNSATVIATNTTAASLNGTYSYSWSVLPSTASLVAMSGGTQTKTLIFSGLNAGITFTLTLRITNASGTVTSSKEIMVNTCVGLSENVLQNNLSVYPNPAHDQLSVSLPANPDAYRVKLINVVGAVVYEEKTLKNSKETLNINLANKAKGIYFLSVESNNEKVVKKIVVE